MSELKKITLSNGAEYEFYNESGDTRSGFYHKSNLYKNGRLVGSRKVNYLNRTWESYRYQTSMMGCVDGVADEHYDRLLNSFKNSKGYAKMTQKRYDEFHSSDLYKNDSIINDCRELTERLRRY